MQSAKSKRPARKDEKSAEVSFRAMLRTSGLVKRVMHPYFARFGVSGGAVGHPPHAPPRRGRGRASIAADGRERPPPDPPAERHRGGGSASADGAGRAEDHVRRSAGQAPEPDARRPPADPPGAPREHSGQIKLVMSGLSVSEQRRLHELLNRLAEYLEATVKHSEKENIE